MNFGVVNKIVTPTNDTLRSVSVTRKMDVRQCFSNVFFFHFFRKHGSLYIVDVA